MHEVLARTGATRTWMDVGADGVTAAAFFAMGALAVVFALRSRDHASFRRARWLAAAFLLACGVSHALEASRVWHGAADAVAAAELATALLSVATLLVLVRVLPQVRALRTTAELEAEVARQTASLREQTSAHHRLERLYLGTVANANIGIAHVSPEGRWLSANPHMCELFGYSERELLALTFQDVTDPRDLEPDLSLVQEVLSGARDHYEMEKRYVRKDGSRFWATLRVSLLRDDDGVPDRFVSVVSDISKAKAAAQALRRQRRALKESNENLEAFTYSISHDLRAPLRAIVGFSSALVEDHGDELGREARRVLDVVHRNAGRMQSMVEALLDFARFGGRAIEVEDVDMHRLAREAFELAEASEVASGRTGQVRTTLHDLPRARVDPALFQHVWSNLATNALKYSRQRELAVLEVGAERTDTEVRYYVKDNGVGFEPGRADQIFGVFQRLHSERDFEGSGVGLAIVQNIVRRHGGRVWAEGRPDEGATLWFALPLEDAS